HYYYGVDARPQRERARRGAAADVRGIVERLERDVVQQGRRAIRRAEPETQQVVGQVPDTDLHVEVGRPRAALAAPGHALSGGDRDAARLRREHLLVLTGRLLHGGQVRGDRLVEGIEVREQDGSPVAGADHEVVAEACARGLHALYVTARRSVDRLADVVVGGEVDAGVEVAAAGPAAGGRGSAR